MAATPAASTTNFQSAAANPTVTVPSGAVVGDRLYAWLSYADTATVVPPTGWTELVGGQMGSGWFSLIYRQMASGVTAATWTTTAVVAATGVYAKSTTTMIVVKGGGVHTVGATTVRSGVSDTALVLGGVTIPTGGLLLAFAGDKLSGQTAVTAPAGMTEEAKYIYAGGGGVSVLIASQSPAAGASGTRTVTYGTANTSAAGVMVAITPSAGTPPAVNAGADASSTTGATKTLTGTSTGTSNLWTQISGPSVTITNPTSAGSASVTPTLAGVYVFRLTGTNSDGSLYDEMKLTVAGTTARPSGIVSNPGGFVAVNAETLEGAVSDGSVSTWIETDASTGDAITIQLAPLQPGSEYHYLITARTSIAPVHTETFALMQGATVIATRTQQMTTAWAVYDIKLTAAEAAAVTNPNDLRVRAVTA